jgi:hypothetical protein
MPQAELVRYFGFSPATRQWEFLVVVDGWIDHEEYKVVLRSHFRYTCFALQSWSRGQQREVENRIATATNFPVF